MKNRLAALALSSALVLGGCSVSDTFNNVKKGFSDALQSVPEKFSNFRNNMPRIFQDNDHLDLFSVVSKNPPIIGEIIQSKQYEEGLIPKPGQKDFTEIYKISDKNDYNDIVEIAASYQITWSADNTKFQAHLKGYAASFMYDNMPYFSFKVDLTSPGQNKPQPLPQSPPEMPMSDQYKGSGNGGGI